MLQEVCEAAGYDVVVAADGNSVLNSVARQPPDMIVIDVGITRPNGLEVLKILRMDVNFRRIPVVVATDDKDEAGRSAGIEAGADDYMSRPYKAFEVQQRVRNALRLAGGTEDRRDGDRRPRRSSAEMQLMCGSAHQLRISIEYELTRAIRYGHQLTCLVLSLDNYDELTVELGQQRAEAALQDMAGALRVCIRGTDQLFRSDRAEFTILLPETSADDAQVVVERLRTRAQAGSLYASSASRPRLALGCSERKEAGLTEGDALLAGARKAMTSLC